tara:strand:+ start:148 stop:678 length:531 start_codon:yes stop_codon:yes gene_type:complete
MITEVYKDFLPKLFMLQLYGHILNTPHRYGHTSHAHKDKDANKWYVCRLGDEKFLSRAVLSFICEKTKLYLNLLEIYANIQYAGQNGSFHIDNKSQHTRTAIIMLSPTLSKDSGTFEIKEEGTNKIETHSFEQNKLLWFKSCLEHKGNAPLEPGPPRVTLAVKTEVLSELKDEHYI